jgi:hypothetical protein
MTRRTTLFLGCAFEAVLILFFVVWSALADTRKDPNTFNDEIGKYGDTNPEIFSCTLAKSKAIQALMGVWFHEQGLDELLQQKNEGEITQQKYQSEYQNEQKEMDKFAERAANYSKFFETFCKD